MPSAPISSSFGACCWPTSLSPSLASSPSFFGVVPQTSPSSSCRASSRAAHAFLATGHCHESQGAGHRHQPRPLHPHRRRRRGWGQRTPNRHCRFRRRGWGQRTPRDPDPPRGRQPGRSCPSSRHGPVAAANFATATATAATTTTHADTTGTFAVSGCRCGPLHCCHHLH